MSRGTVKRGMIWSAVACLLFSSGMWAQVPNTISYQGILATADGIIVADGNYDLTFKLYNVEEGGVALWQEDMLGVPVFEGRFHVILGSTTGLEGAAFDEPYWLGITVNPPSTELPRIKLTSSAYSLCARSIMDDAVTGDKIEDGSISLVDIGPNGATANQVMKWNGSAWVAADDETGAGGDNNWTLVGDVLFTQGEWGIARAGNVLLGEDDSTHVNLGVACTTGTSGQDYKYATVGGGYNNTASNKDATVGGGHTNTASGITATVGGGYNCVASGQNSTVGGGENNGASGHYATVGGGAYNNASGEKATVGGGSGNTASSYWATVGGGYHNTASGQTSTVGGGYANTASGEYATVGGGYHNEASEQYATVAGGFYNTASGEYSFAAGRRAKANHDGTFVWGDGTYADFTSSAVNQFLIRAGGGVGIGTNSPSTALEVNGTVTATAFVGDGSGLTGLGVGNWTLTGDVLYTNDEWGLARAGNVLYGNHDSTHVNLGVACTTGTSGQNYYYNTVGGGVDNTASGNGATIGGGAHNDASGDWAMVGGGWENTASNQNTTVGGGHFNTASGEHATVAGGAVNTAGGNFTAVGGGWENSATGHIATVSGGYRDTATGDYANVGGGFNNTASGEKATVPGGWSNTASGDYSFAAGRRAKANHSGAFVWGDNTDADITSQKANNWIARASGGVVFYTNSALTTGVYCSAGDNEWHSASSRELKRNIRPVDGAELLEKLAELEVSRWSYKAHDESIEHIGPMAQDFYRLFEVGSSDTTIGTIDPAGIALAAIKELDQQNQEQQKRIEELEALVKELLEDRE